MALELQNRESDGSSLETYCMTNRTPMQIRKCWRDSSKTRLLGNSLSKKMALKEASAHLFT